MTIPKVILTHGRAGNVLTLKWLPTAVLCVAESQAPLYREAHPDVEQIVHPDDVKGLLPKRNWLYEKVGDAFQMADDIKEMRSCFTAPGEPVIHATGDHAEALIDRLADEARDLGVYMFGFNPVAHPLGYDDLHPYRLKGLVYGQAFGLLAGSDLYWSKAVRVAGDYWISLLNAYKHRMCLIDQRWTLPTVDMFKGRGPISSTRSQGSEEADNELFRATFGAEVIKQKKPPPGVMNQKLRSTAQRTIRLPF